MRRVFFAHDIVRWSVPCIAAVAVTGCSGAAQPSVPDTTSPAYVQRQIALGQFIPACPDAVSRGKHCLALGIRDKSLVPMSENDGGGAVSGYGPAQLQAAYNIATAAKQKSGGLVAVIEFGGDPNLIGDLAVYRKQFGLPACGKKRACIRVVNQEGKPSPLPPTNAGWLAEQSLERRHGLGKLPALQDPRRRGPQRPRRRGAGRAVV